MGVYFRVLFTNAYPINIYKLPTDGECNWSPLFNTVPVKIRLKVSCTVCISNKIIEINSYCASGCTCVCVLFVCLCVRAYTCACASVCKRACVRAY